ncbi:hypothetical protein HAZT_HAZT006273, partial [Hyalella azteca]
MGGLVSTVLGQNKCSTREEASKKRKLEEEEIDELLKTPKVKKLKTTSEYIYETLFKNGENSDVTLVALGKCWHLHRVYLRQSPYFESMFTGNWKESHDSVVSMTIMDDNVTVEALEKTLGFLYRDELSVTGEQVVGVLAAAVLLQLDPVIQYCSSIMRETINSRTFLQYFHVANRYGVLEVEKLCVEWIERCLLTSLSDHCVELRSLPLEMLQKALASPSLFVIQTEFSVYVFLKMWLFLQLHPNFEGSFDEISIEALKYFKGRQGPCFLDCEEGVKYRGIFWQLRLVYILNHYLDMELIAADNILPRQWLQPAITRQWYNLLRLSQGKDTGPSELPEDIFDRECVRCGRCFYSSSQHIWRWTGFNFDLDLVLFFDGSKLTMKRNNRRPIMFPAIDARKIMFRVTMVDGQRQQGFSQSSGLRSITFGHRTDLKYPLYLSANFLVFTPSENLPLIRDYELLQTNPSSPPARLHRRKDILQRDSIPAYSGLSDDSADNFESSLNVDNIGTNAENGNNFYSSGLSNPVASSSGIHAACSGISASKIRPLASKEKWTLSTPPLFNQPSDSQRPGLIVLDVSDLLGRQPHDKELLKNRIFEAVRRACGNAELGNDDSTLAQAEQVHNFGVQEYNEIENNERENDGLNAGNPVVDEVADDVRDVDDNEREDLDEQEDESSDDERINVDGGLEIADDQVSDDSDDALIEGDLSDDEDLNLLDVGRNQPVVDYVYLDDNIEEESNSDDEIA